MRVPDYHFDSRDQAECMRLMRSVATIIPACLWPSGRRETHHHAARLGRSLDCRPGCAGQTDRLRSQISTFGPLDVPIGPTSLPESHHNRTMATRIR